MSATEEAIDVSIELREDADALVPRLAKLGALKTHDDDLRITAPIRGRRVRRDRRPLRPLLYLHQRGAGPRTRDASSHVPLVDRERWKEKFM
jgi:hypothetical protein